MIFRHSAGKGNVSLARVNAVGASALGIATPAALGLHRGIAVNALSHSRGSWWPGWLLLHSDVLAAGVRDRPS